MRTKVCPRDVNSFCSTPGCRLKKCFKPRHNGHRIVLEEDGSVDIQEHINSFAPYCDLRYMLSRLRVGDSSVLSSRTASYGDFSQFPSDPAGLLNLVADVERRFAELPEETRQASNNDWRNYFVSLFDSSSGDVGSAEPSDSVDKE